MNDNETKPTQKQEDYATPDLMSLDGVEIGRMSWGLRFVTSLAEMLNKIKKTVRR